MVYIVKYDSNPFFFFSIDDLGSSLFTIQGVICSSVATLLENNNQMKWGCVFTVYHFLSTLRLKSKSKVVRIIYVNLFCIFMIDKQLSPVLYYCNYNGLCSRVGDIAAVLVQTY